MAEMLRSLLLALAVVLTTACSGTAQGAAGAGFVAGDGSSSAIPLEQRQAAPPINAPTLAGDMLALADLDGPVVVNFWASWCGPCAKEAPALRNVAKAYKGRVEFVGVDVKDRTPSALNFERDFRIPYPSWEDQAATIAASFGGIGPAALPSTIVLDAQHRVAARMFGAVDEAQLSGALDLVLDEASAGR